MASTATNQIQTGTGEGLLEFLDYVLDKGYGTAAAVGPLRSAARQVFSVVEGGGDVATVDVRGMDLADYLSRFETKARSGDLKVESIQAYRRRFERAYEAYLAFLDSGRAPSFTSRSRVSRQQAAEAKVTSGSASVTPKASGVASASEVARDPMIEYPFPLRSGQVASLRLPVRFERQDAERLAAFVRTLVFDPLHELPRGPSDTESS